MKNHAESPKIRTVVLLMFLLLCMVTGAAVSIGTDRALAGEPAENTGGVGNLEIAKAFSESVTAEPMTADRRQIQAERKQDQSGAAVSLYPGSVRVKLAYSGAQAGTSYLVTLQTDETTEGAARALYVDQVTAEGTSVVFDLYPLELREGELYRIRMSWNGSRPSPLQTVASFRYYGADSLTDLTEDPDKVLYPDVTKEHWAFRFVNEATGKGWFTGFPDGLFYPDQPVTRAQFITVLWRMEGQPAAAAGSGTVFTDVQAGDWYENAVRWGAEKGYILGIPNADGTLSYCPNDSVTREQAMTILYRYDGSPSVAGLAPDSFERQFTDGGLVSEYARNALCWAVSSGYVNGMDDGRLAPQGLATRAQISAILQRYHHA